MTKRLAPYLIAFALCGGPLHGQTLAPELLQRVRAGPARVTISGDSAVLPLVGRPTLPLVEVMVNGRGPYRLLLDLGSNVTLLRRNVVDASGSTVLVERATTDIVLVPSLQAGALRMDSVVVGSYDELDVDGVIGYNALQYTSFTLDFPGRRLSFSRDRLRAGETGVIPYRLEARMPFITVRIGPDTVALNLDTGASEWMTIPPSLQSRWRWSVAPAPGRVVTNNQTGAQQILEGRLADTVRFGALQLANPLVYVNPDADTPWLGASAMLHLVWTFDPAALLVRVTRPTE